MPKLIGLCVLLLFASQQRQCNVGSPESLREKIETSLQPYFANPRGEVLPQQGVLVGYTCLFGAGPQLPVKIRDSIAADRDISQQLALLKLLPLIGGANYRYLVLGFDNGVIRYDLQSRILYTLPPPDGWLEHYRAMCGQ